MSDILSKHGVRIMFKRDSESSVNRGAIMYRGHFRPEMAEVIYTAAESCPPIRDNEMWITEGHRVIRNARDLHQELRAFDIDCTRILAADQDLRYGIARAWAEMVADCLGVDYQVILHGGAEHLHLHIELDP